MHIESTSTPTDRRASLIWRALLAGLLSLALVLVAFGHRPLQAEPQATAYILAGGDWADICADGGVPHLQGDRCMACIVAQAMMLSGPAYADRVTMPTSSAHRSEDANALRAPDGRLAYPARAPPLCDRSTFI